VLRNVYFYIRKDINDKNAYVHHYMYAFLAALFPHTVQVYLMLLKIPHCPSI